MHMIDKRRIDVEADGDDTFDPATSEGADETERTSGDDLVSEDDPDSDDDTDDEEDLRADETVLIGPDEIEDDEANAALDDRETSDGLNELEESVRHAAEDTVTEDDPDWIESLPVFERGMLPRKV